MDNKVNKPLHILLVEDSEGDIFLIQEAFDEANITVNFSLVNDGRDAIDFLRKDGEFLDAMTPDIVLLDLNLPKMNGLEVLDIVKRDDQLKQIPVIMLTTSSSPDDIQKSYSSYVNSYIVKPSYFQNFIDIVKSVEDFWLETSTLPNRVRTIT